MFTDKIATGKAATGRYVAYKAWRSTRSYEWGRRAGAAQRNVLDVNKGLSEHPGGELAIWICAGKDSSKEFNTRHPPDVTDEYSPDAVIGILAVISANVAHGGDGAVSAAAPVSKGKGSVWASIRPAATWLAREIGA